MKVWHPDWPGERFGTVVGEYCTPSGHEYCWVVPPYSERPLSYRRESLTVIPMVVFEVS